MTSLIRARNLTYTYDDGTRALDGVDFDLYRGETVAIFGGNGSGKTTLVLQLAGLLRGEGYIEVCGIRLAKDTLARLRSKIGIVFQEPDEQLFMETVLSDVAFGPRNMGMPPAAAEARAREVLAAVGMSHAASKAPYHLSAGEKRRVALAGVLAMDPEVLILDEPTTYLDPPGQLQLLDLLARLEQSKLIVTHDVAFARALATRAIFFEHGRIAATGGVDEVAAKFHWDIASARPRTGAASFR